MRRQRKRPVCCRVKYYPGKGNTFVFSGVKAEKLKRYMDKVGPAFWDKEFVRISDNDPILRLKSISGIEFWKQGQHMMPGDIY